MKTNIDEKKLDRYINWQKFNALDYELETPEFTPDILEYLNDSAAESLESLNAKNKEEMKEYDRLVEKFNDLLKEEFELTKLLTLADLANHHPCDFRIGVKH